MGENEKKTRSEDEVDNQPVYVCQHKKHGQRIKAATSWFMFVSIKKHGHMVTVLQPMADQQADGEQKAELRIRLRCRFHGWHHFQRFDFANKSPRRRHRLSNAD